MLTRAISKLADHNTPDCAISNPPVIPVMKVGGRWHPSHGARWADQSPEVLAACAGPSSRFNYIIDVIYAKF